MNLLKSREYTTAQLRTKLLQGYYPEAIVQQALDYVASFHYTDDLRYAVGYLTYHENTKSRKRMEMDLLKKGISREIVEAAWVQWEEQGGNRDETAMITRLLEKKNYHPEEADVKEQQKIYAYLLRKGFSGEQIREAMKVVLDIAINSV